MPKNQRRCDYTLVRVGVAHHPPRFGSERGSLTILHQIVMIRSQYQRQTTSNSLVRTACNREIVCLSVMPSPSVSNLPSSIS